MSLYLGLLPLAAQTIQVQVPATVMKGRPFQLAYILQGSSEIEHLDAPKLSGLSLLYGPARQTSSSYQNINGRSSSSVSTQLTFTLLAEQTGTVTIASTRAVVGGRTVSVRGASIKVVPEDKVQQRKTRTSIGEYLYRTLPSRTTVYEQEALPVQYKLYATTEFEISSIKAPEYKGFISQMEPDDGRRQLMLETSQGRTWRTVVMRQEVLFPQQTGQLMIPASEITLRVPAPVTDEDEDFFIGASSIIDRSFSSGAVPIQVLPLPSEGRPADFSGAVGNFTMQAQLLSKVQKTNEALTLRITLQGQGNLKLAKVPEVKFPDSFEVYDPKESYEQQVTSSNVQGKRVIDYYAIPKRVGRTTIPALSFSFFNPKTKRYETLRSQAFDLNITQGKDAPEAEVFDSKNVPQSLAPLSEELGAAAIAGLSLVRSGMLYLAYGVLALIGCGAYIGLRRRQALSADSVGYRASKANKVASQRLRLAQRHLTDGARDAFYEELTKALWGYLGDKLRIPLSQLTRQTIAQVLSAHHLPDATILELTQLLDAADYARYAPAIEGDLLQHYQAAEKLISTIEAHKLQA